MNITNLINSTFIIKIYEEYSLSILKKELTKFFKMVSTFLHGFYMVLGQ